MPGRVSPPRYQLVCSGCARRTADDGLMLRCPVCGDGALLRTEYEEGRFRPAATGEGIFRYGRWLPAGREVPGSSLPSVFRSQRLGRAMGLSDLWVAFSGYWPERGCRMDTGTFKELEAYSVLGRLPPRSGTLVAASAGNTAAAFLAACRHSRLPCLLVVPQAALPVLSAVAAAGSSARVIALEKAGYNEAITYARRIADAGSVFSEEGGVRNVARRDGLAVVALTAYESMGGRLPDYYVQAVGSASGALAAHEAAARITRADSTAALPRLLLCQSAEFAPLHDLWSGKAAASPLPPARVYAPELVNTTPPYALAGGVRDALRRSRGGILVSGRRASVQAAALFEEMEDIDIERPAAVALACLWEAAARGQIPRDARVLLNVTGGGRRRFLATRQLPASPSPHLYVVNAGSDPLTVAAEVMDAGDGRSPTYPSGRTVVKHAG
ncbi:pyridoxal-phosphate dependent enzyme [Streptomyces luteolus]|uniref:Pyridoxal-phosphate dependent enzyme n=1 Tax=Streptomyces luteolus TaxID=3043615 RepID=A0ABT6SZA6_9ACTN|nr:pyridoxal-phosphate dependent enzyme [Streptomyces sp. B-S-A12]MDI3419967.1 pyridoxal-phosphate dependent enzyme [Streptomyces sp. B-S-A12]